MLRGFLRPDTLREWLSADTLDSWLKRPGGFYTAADDTRSSTLRARLRAMPPVELRGLWPNKIQAIASLEKPLRRSIISSINWTITFSSEHVTCELVEDVASSFHLEGDSEVAWFEGNYQGYLEDLKKRKGADADQPHRIKYNALVRS